MTTIENGDVVGFIEMKDGTEEEYLLLEQYESAHADGTADRLMDTLAKLDGSMGGYQINRLEHSLQSATRARRDGADVDWVVAALLHDIGDEYAPYNHSAIAAETIRPYVREEVTWCVEQHGLFQSYYYAHFYGKDRNAKERFADHPWYSLCEEFCARWDQNCFDPDYENDPLESFRADVETVFSRTAWDPDVMAAGPGVLLPEG